MSEESSNKRVVCGGKWITVQDVEELYGMHRKEAAHKFGVKESTFKRKLRKLGILRWPYPKRRSNNSRLKSEKQSIEMRDESISNTKLEFNKLIASSLEDVSRSENESCMIKALSILSNTPTLFSKEQAEQIDELYIDFPALVLKWREYYSRSQTCNLKSSDEIERHKVRYEQLENKEKELMAQLMAVQKEKTENAEKCKQSKDLISMVDNKEQLFTKITTDKMKNLSDKWTNLTSSFIQ